MSRSINFLNRILPSELSNILCFFNENRPKTGFYFRKQIKMNISGAISSSPIFMRFPFEAPICWTTGRPFRPIYSFWTSWKNTLYREAKRGTVKMYNYVVCDMYNMLCNSNVCCWNWTQLLWTLKSECRQTPQPYTFLSLHHQSVQSKEKANQAKSPLPSTNQPCNFLKVSIFNQQNDCDIKRTHYASFSLEI